MHHDLKAQFIALVGEKYAPDDHAPYLQELRGLYKATTPLVLRPANTGEVAAIVKLANDTHTKIVPQGGATGLVGGHIPISGDEVIVSLNRMNNLRESDPAGNWLAVDAGMTLANVQHHAQTQNRMFPLSLPSEGSCTIGGNLSTNAGGTAVLAYGNTRDLVLGIEVVLPSGEIMNMMRNLKKDNTGYDLRHLFMGAEGTLGIITGVVVKLYPAIKVTETAFIGLESPHHALKLLQRAQELAGSSLTTFEILPRFGLEVVTKHGVDCRNPLVGTHNWYILMELTSTGQALRETMENILTTDLIEDAMLAESEAARKAIWRNRHMMTETQTFEGGSIKHDISISVHDVPRFIDECLALLHDKYPTCRPLPFGHMGDGNLHFNVTQPVGADKQAFLSQWVEMNALVHGLVTAYGGSISAEHGIGQLKRYLLPKVKDPVTLATMKAIKNTLDPKGIMNPGKVL
jgi:FAD/FMN-containing dehydrogenase